MNPEEFEPTYAKICAEAPAYVTESLAYFFRENSILHQSLVSSESIDKAEITTGRKLPIAITLFDGRKWFTVFRDQIYEAPYQVLRAVIHHEIAHMFVTPILRPLPFQKNLPKLGRERIKAFREMFEKETSFRHSKASLDDTYEEGLVSFMNTSWGNDEAAAHSWLNTTK